MQENWQNFGINFLKNTCEGNLSYDQVEGMDDNTSDCLTFFC